MSAIVADAGAEVVANGAGCGFLGVGRAHGFTPFQNGAFGFEDQSEDFAGTHERSELGEERPVFVDGIEAAGFFFRETHRFDGDDREAGFVNPCKDFTLLAAADGIGFDDCESSFDRHNNLLGKAK